MCLAIPGKVIETYDQGGLRMARVQFGGITREACLEYLPETQTGEYVLVHVGFAISKLDRESAEKTLDLFRQMGALQEEMASEEEAFARAAAATPSPCPDGSCAK